MWQEIMMAVVFIGAIVGAVAIVRHCKNTEMTRED